MDAIEKDKVFVEEALQKIPLWPSVPTSWKIFLSIPQRTYLKTAEILDVDLEQIGNVPKVLFECLIKFGECEINSRLTLHFPRQCKKFESYLEFGRYNRAGHEGALLYLPTGNESIYLHDPASDEVTLISEDLSLLLALETVA